MGLAYQHIRLSNAAKPELAEIDANALVDGGAADLCIPRLVALQLKLQPVDYVGPILVEVFGRRPFTGGMVMGEQVLLGAIPMESMDALIEPRHQQLIPNPAHPNVPGALAMGIRTSHRD